MVYASDVATRPAETRDYTEAHRVAGTREYYRYRRCCRLCRHKRRNPAGNDDAYRMADQLSRQCWQTFVVTLRPAKFKCNVLTFHVAGVSEALTESGHIERRLGGCSIKDSDNRHALLRARDARPRRRAAEQRYDLAPSQSIQLHCPCQPWAELQDTDFAAVSQRGGPQYVSKRK